MITNSPRPHILTHGFALAADNETSDPMARAGLAFSSANTDKTQLLLANEIATWAKEPPSSRPKTTSAPPPT